MHLNISHSVGRAAWSMMIAVGWWAAPLQAGPPLICQPLDIGTAQSLPAGAGRFGTSPQYDRTRVVDDTLALLTPTMPLIVRMETLRRATIYATEFGTPQSPDAKDHPLALILFKRLLERQQADRPGEHPQPALLGFDVGYYMQCLQQAGMDVGEGYGFLAKAAGTLDADPEIHFALALASAWPRRAENAEHVARARAAATQSALLAANLSLLDEYGVAYEEIRDPAR